METTAIVEEIFDLLEEQQKLLEGALSPEVEHEYSRRSLLIKELLTRLAAGSPEWVM